MFWPHSLVQSIYKGGNHQHLPQADAKEQFLQRFACKAVISQPGTKNANSGTNNRQTKAPTHTQKKNISILTFPSCPCLCSSLADGLKKSARPWHCSVHQFIAPDWNICRKENCIDITTNEQIVCAIAQLWLKNINLKRNLHH